MSIKAIPIKAQYNAAKKYWQIVKRNPSGAWEILSNITHQSEPAAEAMVDWYIESYPTKFCKTIQS